MSKTRQAARSAVKADRKVSRKATKHRDAPAVKVAGTLSALADQPPLVALSIATIVGGLVLRKPGVAKTGLRMLASHAVATGIKTLVKHSVDRTRPEKAQKSGHRFEQGRSGDHDETSFPSGHTAGAVAIARAVARDHPAAALPAYGTAGAVAVALVPSGKHYPIDTLAGAAIGVAGEWIASAALRGAAAALADIRRRRISARRPDRSSPT